MVAKQGLCRRSLPNTDWSGTCRQNVRAAGAGATDLSCDREEGSTREEDSAILRELK